MASVFLNTCDCSPCTIDKFRINGIRANEEDFGEIQKEHLGNYSCRLSGFSHGKLSQEILDKYNISFDEFYEICDRLDEVFDYGHCSYCR